MIKEIKYNRSVNKFKVIFDYTHANPTIYYTFYSIRMLGEDPSIIAFYHTDSIGNIYNNSYYYMEKYGLTFGLGEYEIGRLICSRHKYNKYFCEGKELIL